MGGKHGKYVYVLREDGWYVKVRVFKSRETTDASRYIVLSFKTRKPPLTYPVMRIDELPSEVQEAVRRV